MVIDHGRTVAAGTLRELKAGIGLDVIEAAVADAAQLDDVSQVLAGVVSAEPRLDRPARRVTVPAARGPAELGAAISGLAGAGVSVEEIGLRRPRLDEVFLALTGEAAGRSQP